MIKRIFDLALGTFSLILFGIPLTVVFIAVRITSPGPALYWSKRIGKNNEIFLMPKFRSMKINTPQVATHLLANPDMYLTSIGSFIRKTSLDELPQLLSVLKGDMSFVGPRPALFNQEDLIALRTAYGIEKLKPGITGWAQINGRDEIPIPKKVEYDKYYLENQSLTFDIKIIILTAIKVIKRDGINH
ncbi:sugar transferase [Bdellovibrio bacteriovorus]|uniref:sugar transferase n=1 Tax=Bdellovibrio bacteriovorus TaxID=959 RepID=UPI0035A5AE80